MSALAAAQWQPGACAAQRRRQRRAALPPPLPHRTAALPPCRPLSASQRLQQHARGYACRRQLAARPAAAADAGASTSAGAAVDSVDDPATAFDWGIALALAGASFEAYNSLEDAQGEQQEGQKAAAGDSGSGGSASLKMRSMGGVEVSFLDRWVLGVGRCARVCQGGNTCGAARVCQGMPGCTRVAHKDELLGACVPSKRLPRRAPYPTHASGTLPAPPLHSSAASEFLASKFQGLMEVTVVGARGLPKADVRAALQGRGGSRVGAVPGAVVCWPATSLQLPQPPSPFASDACPPPLLHITPALLSLLSRPAQWWPGSSADAYAVVNIGDSSGATGVVKGSLDPAWGDRFYLFVR